MYNRYVDGLGTLPAQSQDMYTRSAQGIVEVGYVG
jgi:hypothetical protein